ncbi:MAG: hypothetical protein ACOVRK_01630 [Chryseobacterium taeanense]
MVHFKITIQAFITSIILMGCNNKSTLPKLDLKTADKLDFKTYQNQYCFGDIYKQVSEKSSANSNYYNVDTIKIFQSLNKSGDMAAVNNFRDFVSYTTDTNFYLLKNGDKDAIVAIGQSSGASALGADYWNYLCYLIPERKELKFTSLINSPYSLFISNNSFNYVEVADNIPRPASGEVVKLNYTPLIIDTYDTKKSKLVHFEMNCSK